MWTNWKNCFVWLFVEIWWNVILICNCLSDGCKFITEIEDDGASVSSFPVIWLIGSSLYCFMMSGWLLVIQSAYLETLHRRLHVGHYTEEFPGSFFRQNRWSIIVRFDHGRVIITMSSRTSSSKIFPETVECLGFLVHLQIHNGPRLRQVIVE